MNELQKYKTETTLHHALQAAEQALRNNQEDQILPLLEPWEPTIDAQPDKIRSFYSRLKAFALVNGGKITEAESIARQVLSSDPTQLDFYFIKMYIAMTMREYDVVLEQYEMFSQTYDPSLPDNTQIVTSPGYLSQLYNLAGVARMESRQFDEASELFEKSIATDKGNHLPYINLFNLYRFDGKIDKAKKTVDQGLSVCRQVQELRLLKEQSPGNATISACMIVKNEEELLGDCLASIRDWVDEIIVVDTGSTDSTVDIAKEYGAKIFHQQWEGNFSKHRNYSVEQASSDWIFIIDADERMYQEDIDSIRQLINNEDVNIISINVYNVYGENEQTKTFLPSVRLWRKNQDLRYEGIVHNLLNLGVDHPVVRADVRLKHLGYDLSREKMAAKYHRTKSLLEDQLQEDPDNSFALFNYAQLLKGDKSHGDSYPTQNIPEIVGAAAKAVNLTDPKNKKERHIHLMCLDQLAWAYFYKHEYSKSEEYIEQALALKPNYLDPILLKGHIHAQRKEWTKATAWYQKYLNVQKEYQPDTETDPLILAHVDSRASAYYSLGLIAEQVGDTSLAETYYLKTLDIHPAYIETNHRLGQLYARQNQFEKAKSFFEKQLALAGGMPESYIGLARIAAFEKDNSRAIELFDEGMTKFTLDTNLLHAYANFLTDQQKFEDVIDLLKNATLDSKNRSVLANAFFVLGQYQNAIEQYEQVRKIDGLTPELFNDLGNCYFKLKQYEQAIQIYEAGIETDHTVAPLYRNLGLALASLDNREEALRHFTTYTELVPEDYSISEVIGKIHMIDERYAEALPYFEKSLEYTGHNISVLMALSDCYLHMGHEDSAKTGYREILKTQPDFSPAKNRLEQLNMTTENSC